MPMSWCWSHRDGVRLPRVIALLERPPALVGSTPTKNDRPMDIRGKVPPESGGSREIPASCAALGVGKLTAAPSISIRPVVGWYAREDADQRRLARAVVAEKAQHLARPNFEIDVMQHVDRAEALVQCPAGRGSGRSCLLLPSSWRGRQRHLAEGVVHQDSPEQQDADDKVGPQISTCITEPKAVPVVVQPV